jgi:carboxypeptidase C (cathepsin A)
MMIFITFIALVIADNDGPWSIIGLKGYSGQIVVNETSGSFLFYLLYFSIGGNIDTDTRPIILWLDGGPGCSGELGMICDKISPLYINSTSNPVYNRITWAQNFHLLSVDFPYNVGFSVAESDDDLQSTTSGAVTYLYTFLQILNKKYPTWFKRDLYIFGESYGGHWVPGAAYKIIMENKSIGITNNAYLRLKGIGMQDPLCDAYYQSQYYDFVGYSLGILNNQERSIIRHLQSQEYLSIKHGNFLQANTYQEFILSNLSDFAEGMSIYDIRTLTDTNPGGCVQWLNLNSTKNMFHAPNVQWTECNNEVYNYFKSDITSGAITAMMPTILENIKVMIWNGQDDLIVNTVGVENFLSGIQWPFMPNFLRSRKAVWKVQGSIAGYAQSYSNMTFVVLLKAGHSGNLNQPVAIIDMVNRFIFDQGWN